MSVSAEELEQYNGKRVVVTKNLKEPNEKGELAVEIEGTVEAANALGLMVKPKGRVNLELIELADIEAVAFAPEKLTPIKQKVLKLVTHGEARKHLAERHGIDLEWINANSEAAALEYHNSLDHTNLGHRHEAKDKAPAAEAVAESEDNAA